jgi:XrtJ-associated TM-motif-TM protein
MKRSTVVLFGCAALVLVAVPLHAQIGCVDSPENPTAVLALVGGAGALYSAVRARTKARRGK